MVHLNLLLSTVANLETESMLQTGRYSASMVICSKTQFLVRMFPHTLSTWTALLTPNFIANNIARR